MSLAEKNCKKEGAKKAQSFSAINKQTHSEYFCALTENVHGDASLLDVVMQGINSDKKASQWGKILLTFDDTSVMALAHVPEQLSVHAEGMNAQEWLNELRVVVPKLHIIQSDDKHQQGEGDAPKEKKEWARAVIRVEQQEELFPFKLCDALVQANFDLLKKRGLLTELSSEDDEDYAAEAGVEW